MKRENKNVALIIIPQLMEFLKNGLWDHVYLSEWILLFIKNSWRKIKGMEVFREVKFKLSSRRCKSWDIPCSSDLSKWTQKSPALFTYRFFIDNGGYYCSDSLKTSWYFWGWYSQTTLADAEVGICCQWREVLTYSTACTAQSSVNGKWTGHFFPYFLSTVED